MKLDIDEKDIEWIESTLRKFDFVNWDRYGADVNKNVSVYGWIDRPKDNYKDFILLEFVTSDQLHINYMSSSAKYATKIHTLLYGTTAKLGECQRVEDKFKIKNCIKLTKCPEDADWKTLDFYKTMCTEEHGDYYCTRKKGHKGAHHSHGDDGNCNAVWQ